MNAPERIVLGVVPDMPAKEYHASGAIGNSALNVMARSMWHYWSEYRAPNRPPRGSTPAMQAGTLAHCAILEPLAFADRYVIKPEGHDGRTKEGKAWLAAAPAGVEIISAEQHETAKAQRAAVLAVPELAEILRNGAAEVSAFWTDDVTGVPCKCRPDWVHRLPDRRVVLFDLKTTPDAAPDQFGRSVWNYGYHRQAAFYSAGFEAATGESVAAFVFGAVSATYPFLAVPYMLDDEAMARGRESCRELLARYAECNATDKWPAYGDGVQLLNLPAWAK